MKKSITLQLVTAYVVTSIEERVGIGYHTEILGYYSESAQAHLAAKGKGDWGKDAEVMPKTVLQDTQGNLYSADVIGRFADLDKEHKDKLLKSIKAKLTPEEWEFYNRETRHL